MRVDQATFPNSCMGLECAKHATCTCTLRDETKCEFSTLKSKSWVFGLSAMVNIIVSVTLQDVCAGGHFRL